MEKSKVIIGKYVKGLDRGLKDVLKSGKDTDSGKEITRMLEKLGSKM